MAWEEIRDQFSIEDIGAPLLANLAKGIYTPEAVLREYVQNSADAYLDVEEHQKKKLLVTEKQIDIYLQDNNTLAIQDNGIGMDAVDIKHYKRIALSPKLGKDRAGFRGIGIWAGFSACDQLQVETTKLGDAHKYRLTLKFGEMRQLVNRNINLKQLLDKRIVIEVASAQAADHYTQVRLVNLHDEFVDLLKEEELARIVRQILPCRIDTKFKFAPKITEKLQGIDGYQEFLVNVNDVEIFRLFPANVTEPVFETLSHDGREYAFVWYCTSPTVRSFKSTEASNFRLRARNIGVGGPGIYSQEDGSHWGVRNSVNSPELLDWYIGEIHILDPEVKPNTPRSELELDADSRRAITLMRTFYEERITYRRANSDVNSHIANVTEVTGKISRNEPIEPGDGSRFLKGLKKYETLSKPGKTKLEGIDVEKRKILRQREASDSSIVKNRPEAIECLEQLVGERSGRPGRRGKPGTPAKGSAGEEESGDRTGSAGTSPASLTEYETLLSEILLIIEKQLGDQEELASKLSEAVEGIFKRHGLLVTV